MKNTVKNTENTTAPKYCFSYVRFSSEGQRDGSSVERQSPIAAKVATEKGWILREEWNSQDLAVSAYKGDNIKTIESIIDSVKSGKIPAGSVMIIEAFDRFSRADLDTAEDLLKKALKTGLEIYVERGGHHLTKESINKPIDRIIALLELVAANEYSAKISNRVKDAVAIRGNKIAKGAMILKTKEGKDRKDIPVWITNTGTKFELNEVAEIIALIFKMYLDGIGPAAIARKFNDPKEKIPSLSSAVGKDWSQSIIYRLLSDRRTIGEAEVIIGETEVETIVDGKPIKTFEKIRETVKGYYPVAVTKETFDKVQAKLDDNRGKPTKQGNKDVCSLFTGIAYCRCGERIKVSSGSATGGKYISCQGHLKGLGCNDSMVKYQPFEDAFMNILRLKPAQLMREENGDSVNAQMQILKGRKAEAEKQIANIQGYINKGLASDSMVKTQISLETQLSEINQQIEIEASKTVAAKGGIERLMDILLSLRNLQTDQSLRLRIQGWIRENVNRVTVDRPSKEFTVDLKKGDCVTMNFSGNILGIKSLQALFGNHNRTPEQALAEVAKTA
jgi:DNA invertase Pin-like site-specific DNA recombinase